MPYDEALAVRLDRLFARRRNVERKKMFGGVAYLQNGNMLVGVWKEFLIARLGPEQTPAALTEPFVKPFDITGKASRNMVMVGPEALSDDAVLAAWVERSRKFVGKLPAK